jgi:hypothetical protein
MRGAGHNADDSPAIRRVVEWAKWEALHRVSAMHPGECHQHRDNGPPMPGGHPCQKKCNWAQWPPPRDEFLDDFTACVNRCAVG